MGEGIGSGESRAEMACSQALDSPLLFSQSIRGAKHILLNITSGSKVTLTRFNLFQIRSKMKPGRFVI